jgi:hypothetical protein
MLDVDVPLGAGMSELSRFCSKYLQLCATSSLQCELGAKTYSQYLSPLFRVYMPPMLISLRGVYKATRTPINLRLSLACATTTV